MITSLTAGLNRSSPDVVAVNSVLYHLKLLSSYPFYYQIDARQTRHTSTCVDSFLAGCGSSTALNFLGATPEVNKLKWQYPHLHRKMPVELVLFEGPAERRLSTNPIEPLIQNGHFLWKKTEPIHPKPHSFIYRPDLYPGHQFSTYHFSLHHVSHSRT
jgi:hypothetical protein